MFEQHVSMRDVQLSLLNRLRRALLGTVNESSEKTTPEKVGISGASSLFITWLLVAAANQISIYRSSAPRMSIETHVLVHIYDFGHCITLMLFSAGLWGAFRRWGRESTRLAIFGLFLGAFILSFIVIPPDLSNLSVRMAENRAAWISTAILAGGVAVFSLAPPIAFLFGRLLARPYFRWLGVVVGYIAFTSHALILREFYHGIHLFIVLTGTILFSASLTGAVLPNLLARRFSRQAPRFLRNATLALVTAIAAYSIGRAPPARVAAELVRLDAFLLPHYLLRFLHAPMPLRDEPIPAEMKEWFVNRENHPPIPPSNPPLFSNEPIVILLTIDCLRSDVVMSGKHDALLPGLAALRNGSTSFAIARSTAPGTISSLASIFTSTHFSQQYWVPVGTKKNPFPDDHVRFPELLAKSKVATITFTGAPGLVPSFGLMRGFTETTDLQRSRKYATAEQLMTAAMRRLKKAAKEKVFLHLHFLEPHHPYDLGIQKGSQYDRYLSEVQLVDQQLERLKQFLFTEGMADRTLLIVSADHGEAFGEHGTIHHSATIYDELLRVPLLLWRSKQPGRVVSEPVSLIDLGPTILDTLGVPTPGHFMGQSLVPFVRGENPKLTRPILAEARLKQALVLPDGYKIIVDNRLNTVELYDLRKDPDETDSLAEDEEVLSRPLSLLRQFYDVHRNPTPGYSPPYRVW
jgi:Sulfatase